MGETAAIVVMGVSGSGKSTVGARLGAALHLPFHDADEFHPAANIAKMTSGIPLEDADRWPWLDAIGRAIHDTEGGVVIACSALKRAYRGRIRAAAGRPVAFVYLEGSRQVLAARLGGRTGHFMPPSLLDSQLATLEPPTADEHVIRVSIDLPVEAEVESILAQLQSTRA